MSKRISVDIDSVIFVVDESCPECGHKEVDAGETSIRGMVEVGWPICLECGGDLNLSSCTAEVE